MAAPVTYSASAGAVISVGIDFGTSALIGGISTGTWRSALDGGAGGFCLGFSNRGIGGGLGTRLLIKI